MTEQTEDNRPYEIDLSDISFDEEDDSEKQPIIQYRNNEEVQYLQEELSKTQKALKEIETHINKNRTNWVEEVFAKFTDVDPGLKQFVYTMFEGYDKASLEEKKGIFQALNTYKTDLAKLTTNLDRTNKWVNDIETNNKFRSLVKKSLENSFKKQSITEVAIDSAIATHAERIKKDPAYRLKVDDIVKAPSTTLKEKEALLGELIHQTLAEKITRSKKRREGDPILKTNKTVNEDAEKAKKAMESGVKEAKEVKRLDPEQAKSKASAILHKLLER